MHRDHLILSYQRLLLHKVNQIMATLADMQTAQTALFTAVDSLLANADAIEAQLLALIAAGSVTPAQLQTLVDASNAETAKIAADLASRAPPAVPVSPAVTSAAVTS